MTRDLVASIRARLLRRAKQHEEPFELTLVRYATERFLYRLGLTASRPLHAQGRGAALSLDERPVPCDA